MNSQLLGNTLLAAGGVEIVPRILEILQREGMQTRANPDMYVRTYTHFGIDEARELRERASLRAVGERRVFIIVAPDISREAQNALLKTVEEAPGNAIFFFVVFSPDTLLPTLRSRAQLVSFDETKEEKQNVDVKTFLNALPQKRLDMLKPLLDRDENDRRDLSAILAFLSSLERAFEKKPNKDGLSAVYRARRYISDKGAIVKPLLEQVALLVPRI